MLHAQAVYSMIEAAEHTRQLAEELVNKLHTAGQTINLAGLYTQFSLHSFSKSNYNEVSPVQKTALTYFSVWFTKDIGMRMKFNIREKRSDSIKSFISYYQCGGWFGREGGISRYQSLPHLMLMKFAAFKGVSPIYYVMYIWDYPVRSGLILQCFVSYEIIWKKPILMET